MKVKCLHCNKDFDKKPSEIKKSANNFCSRKCSSTHNNFGKPHNPPRVRKCKCGKEFFCSSIYRSESKCPDCFISLPDASKRAKSRTLQKLIEDTPSVKSGAGRLQAVIRAYNRNWNRNLRNRPCQVCGYDKHTELAHKRAVSSFPKTATLGEINHPDNQLCLCPNCHWEYDSGLLKI